MGSENAIETMLNSWRERAEYSDNRFYELEEKVEHLVAALRFYASMRFNHEKGEWMPGTPDRAINALAIFGRPIETASKRENENT